MTFMKTYSWSATGFTFLVGAWALQCGVLFQGIWRMTIIEGFAHKINVNLLALIEAEFCAGACFISVGALLGKTTFPQLMLIVTFEAICFTLNSVILFDFMKVRDAGGSMSIHMFGTFFGIAAAYFFEPARALKDERKANGGNYNSQLLAMIGTLFLWMYWPSACGILSVGLAQQRAIINTTMAISASALAAIAVSRIAFGKIHMAAMLNASVAGGVMIGAACDIIVSPGLSMLVGAIAGAISAIGYLFGTVPVREKLNM